MTAVVSCVTAGVVPATAETVKVVDGYAVEVDRSVTGNLRLAHSLGLTYSPIVITRAARVMETRYPNARIEWLQIFTTA